MLFRLNLHILFNEALLTKGEDFIQNLHQCVLDSDGNTIIHYCVFYKLGTIGNTVLELSGSSWWKVVLQENFQKRNAFEHAKWVGNNPRNVEDSPEDIAFLNRVEVGVAILILHFFQSNMCLQLLTQCGRN